MAASNLVARGGWRGWSRARLVACRASRAPQRWYDRRRPNVGGPFARRGAAALSQAFHRGKWSRGLSVVLPQPSSPALADQRRDNFRA